LETITDRVGQGRIEGPKYPSFLYTQNVPKPKQQGGFTPVQGGEIPVQQSKTLNAATLRIAQPLKASIDSLTQEQIDKARMVKASRIAYEKDFKAAQTYLDEQGIPYDIDTSLSSKESCLLETTV
jgi:hypothetical protein